MAGTAMETLKAASRRRQGVALLLLPAVATALVAALLPQAAAAQVSGPCRATGYVSASPQTLPQLDQAAPDRAPGLPAADLTQGQVWSVPTRGYLTISAQSALAPHVFTGSLVLFGIPLPLFGGRGTETRGFSGPWRLEDIAPFTRVLGLDGHTDSCSGSLMLKVNESPFSTAGGIGGIAAGVLGGVALALLAFRRRRVRVVVDANGRSRTSYSAGRRLGAILIGLFFGFVAGVGEGLYMQEVGTFSPLDPRALAIPALGVALGLLAGLLGGRRSSRSVQSREVATPGPDEPVPDRFGTYQVRRRLGSGSTGTVYLAYNENLDRPVALKELRAGAGRDALSLERFRGEAQTLAKLNHPNCVRVYDFFEESGSAYLVSEYIEGPTLRRLVDQTGRLTPECALGVLEGALNGLGHAHALGLVHRDVKPENILVDSKGVSKLVDFGLAAPAAGQGRERPAGTPNYMSPEQIRGDVVDARSDIYSAGALLFELLTSRPPFQAGSAAAVLSGHLSEPVPDPRTVAREIPGPVAAMVRRSLAKNPSERQQTADEFVSELESAAAAGYGSGWRERASLGGAVAALAGSGALATMAGTAGEAAVATGTTAAATTVGGQVAVTSTAATASAAAASSSAAAGGGAATGSGSAVVAGGHAAHATHAASAGLLAKLPVPAQIVAGAATAAIVVAAAPALQVPVNQPSDVISPAQAAQVFVGAWKVGQEGFGNNTSSGVDSISAGQALEDLRSTIDGVHGDTVNALQRSLTITKTYVPHQTGYPAQFIAYGHVDMTDKGIKSGVHVLAVFVRTAPGEDWKMVSLDYENDLNPLPRIALGADGYAAKATPKDLGNLAVPPASIPGMYTGYLTAGVNAGGASSGQFSPGLYTTAAVKQDLDNAAYEKGRRVATRYVFTPGQTSQIYPLSGGGAIVVFGMASTVFYDYLPGDSCPRGSYLFYEHPGGLVPAGPLTFAREHYVGSVFAVDPSRSRQNTTNSNGTPAVDIVGGAFAMVSLDSAPCPHS